MSFPYSIIQWSDIYESHAPSMYGVIIRLTGNDELAQKILVLAFAALKKDTDACCHCKTLLHISRYTYCFTVEYLKENDRMPLLPAAKNERSILFLLNTQCSSLQQAAVLLGLTPQQALVSLRNELLLHRKKVNV